MAGSLNYWKSQLLVEEIARVCRPGATVVIYDFVVPVWPVLEMVIEDKVIRQNQLLTSWPSTWTTFARAAG